MHDVEKEFGYTNFNHVAKDFTPKEFLDKGIINKNIIGVEVIANNDKDVLAIQSETVRNLVRTDYPSTPVYGHGELNPIERHREPDEGKTITDQIREERTKLANAVVRNGKTTAENGILDGKYRNKLWPGRTYSSCD